MEFEVAMGTSSSGVNNAFGNALMVKVGDLFSGMGVFDQRWTL